MGYTPVFDTVFDGTLCGKWPTLPVWLTLLPLADWRGHIDMTPQAIAVRTGWPLELLKAGLAELCSPDPDSRSPDEGGRRLVLIEPETRVWGWRVVNIQLYRRKCNDVNQVADGRNAEKVKRYKERHRETPRDTAGHSETPETLNSYSDSYSDSDKKQINGHPPSAFDRFWSLYPKKVGKKPARDVWKRRGLDSLAERICSGIPSRVENDPQWKKGFIPHPVTFLQQERWNDEFAEEGRKWE